MKINFLGNGSGFSNSHNNAYFITPSNDLVFIDLSMMHYETITNFPLHKFHNIYVLVTHIHDDHTSGIGLFAQYCYYVLHKELIVVAPNNLLNILKIDLLIKGIPENIYIATYPNTRFKWFREAIEVNHAPELEKTCYGYILNIEETTCIYSGDTNSIEPFEKYLLPGCELYLDISYSYGRVHIKYEDVKDKLIEYSNNKIKIILMHVDDICSIKKEIKNTSLEIAEIKSLNVYSNEEIKAIKFEVCFNKVDLINKINYLLNDTSIEGDEAYNLDKLLDSLENQDIEPITPDFTQPEIEGYFIYINNGTIEKAKAKDFYFEYDKENKCLYCSAFSW